MSSQAPTKRLNAAQMIARLDLIEVTETDRQCRTVMMGLRDTLAGAIKANAGIADAMAHTLDIATMWGYTTDLRTAEPDTDDGRDMTEPYEP